jgi:DUF438 domain-containing protein
MELLARADARIERLLDLLTALKDGPVSRETFDSFSDVTGDATSHEVNAAIHRALSSAETVSEWKQAVSRFIRSVASALDREGEPAYPGGHLLARLTEENSLIAEGLARLQEEGARTKRSGSSLEDVRSLALSLEFIKDHYVALQNELFPLFERASSESSCVTLMWEMQDEALAALSALCLESASGELAFWKALGEFVITAGTLAYRERKILFPVAYRAIPESLFATALDASASPDTSNTADPSFTPDAESTRSTEPVFRSPTGSLSNKELEAIFGVLPVDIAFIGNDDRVRYYSDPPHRVFPRSPAVIGRLVQNCHPPKSVATVEKILSSFKEGTSSCAEFWLTMKGAFIHIRYYAVRDAEGKYMGTLEVSQDVTAIRSLEGEKRLL